MEDKVRAILAAVLGIEPGKIGEDTSPATVPQWDSLKHINLVFALEEEFPVQFTDEEIPQLVGYRKILDTLRTKLSVGSP